jgi:hypothetical protein
MPGASDTFQVRARSVAVIAAAAAITGAAARDVKAHMANVADGCGPTSRATVRVNELRQLLIHDGLVRRSGCDLLLVGERVGSTASGVLVASSDGGAHVRIVASFPGALHVRGIAQSERGLWIVGDTRSGHAFVARARDARGRWTRLPMPAWFESASTVAIDGSAVWVGGQRSTQHGIEALVLERAGENGRFRVAARIRPALGRAAYVPEIAAAGGFVVVAGTDSINGVVLARDGAGRPFYRVLPDRVLGAANGAAVMPPHAYAAASSARAPSGELLVAASGSRSWRAQRVPHSTKALDVTFVTPSIGYVIAATGHGTTVFGTSSGGGSWRPLARLPNVFAERLIGGATTYAVGPSGLYRVARP